jgi:hypothetical protein
MQGLGCSLAQARQGPFFSWFCLEPYGQIEDAGTQTRADSIRSRHRFRPSGPSFRSLVVLELGLDPDQVIVTASLRVDRTFIASPRIRPFARDLTASFLRWALPEVAQCALTADIERIGQFCDGQSTVIVPRGYLIQSWLRSLRALHLEPAAAEVFIGRRRHARRRIGGTPILFENLQEGWLRIVVGPDGGT